jgi:hypothetical protein
MIKMTQTNFILVIPDFQYKQSEDTKKTPKKYLSDIFRGFCFILELRSWLNHSLAIFYLKIINLCREM